MFYTSPLNCSSSFLHLNSLLWVCFSALSQPLHNSSLYLLLLSFSTLSSNCYSSFLFPLFAAAQMKRCSYSRLDGVGLLELVCLRLQCSAVKKNQVFLSDYDQQQWASEREGAEKDRGESKQEKLTVGSRKKVCATLKTPLWFDLFLCGITINNT